MWYRIDIELILYLMYFFLLIFDILLCTDKTVICLLIFNFILLL